MSGDDADLFVRFARIAAVALTACGLFLIFLDAGTPSEPSRLRRRLTELWRNLAEVSFVTVPDFAVGAVMRAVNRFVVYWYEQSPRNVATAGSYTLIVFVAIPLAATLNWFRGGSPALLLILLFCVFGMVALAVMSEIKIGPSVTRLLSPLLYGAIFLFVPAYVFVSLTDRILSMPIGHGMLVSILLSPLLYLIGHSAVLLGAGTFAMPLASRDATALRHILTLFAAALPFAYLATFAGLLVWHLAAPELPVPSTWRLLTITSGAGALAAAVGGHLLTRSRRTASMQPSVAWPLGIGTAIAVVLALMAYASSGLPVGGSVAPFLVPVLMPLAIIGLIVLALLGKVILVAVQAVFPDRRAAEQPYRVAGILGLLLAAVIGWASVAL